MSSGALINVPEKAKRGEIIEIKTLVSHPMETGYRRTQLGVAIPRDIIRTFVCAYNGVEVFRADLHPAITANPLSPVHWKVSVPLSVATVENTMNGLAAMAG